MDDTLNIKAEKDLPVHKPIMLFGRDITEIACFRSSLICGICTGVVGGLASFMGTSKTLFSTHIAFASLWVGVFAYWIPCRYNYESKHLMIAEVFQKKKEEKRKQEAENKEDSS